MQGKRPSLYLSARDCLSRLEIHADMDYCSIEYRAHECIGNGEWILADGEIGIDQIFELHAFLSQMIDIYALQEKEREEREVKRD